MIIDLIRASIGLYIKHSALSQYRNCNCQGCTRCTAGEPFVAKGLVLTVMGDGGSGGLLVVLLGILSVGMLKAYILGCFMKYFQ